jgi:hypothetical protein
MRRVSIGCAEHADFCEPLLLRVDRLSSVYLQFCEQHRLARNV